MRDAHQPCALARRPSPGTRPVVPARGRPLHAEPRLRELDRPWSPEEAHEVDAVFIDSSHEYEETVETFTFWSARLRPGGVVVFHDRDDPSYPGVSAAIRGLGLRGEAHGHLFVWRKTPRAGPATGEKPPDGRRRA